MKITSNQNNNNGIKTEPGPRLSLTGKNTNFAADNHTYTFGINIEDRLKMTERKIGNLPVKTSLAFFNSAGAHFGKKTAIIETSAITGKIQYDFSESANVYLKADAGILNAGYFAGKATGGIGVKGTIGAELGHAFIEAFKEENTNTYSLGLTLGIKL